MSVSGFTLDGDLGIGGGPPGLRVWLDASLPLSELQREREGKREMEGKTVKITDYRECTNKNGKQ